MYLFYLKCIEMHVKEIKNVLYKSVLAETAAVAHYTKFQAIQHKTDNISIFKERYVFRSQHE